MKNQNFILGLVLCIFKKNSHYAKYDVDFPHIDESLTDL